MDEVKPFQRFEFTIQFEHKRVAHTGKGQRCNVSEDSAWSQVRRDLYMRAGYRMIKRLKSEVLEVFPLHQPVPGGREWTMPVETYDEWEAKGCPAR